MAAVSSEKIEYLLDQLRTNPVCKNAPQYGDLEVFLNDYPMLHFEEYDGGSQKVYSDLLKRSKDNLHLLRIVAQEQVFLMDVCNIVKRILPVMPVIGNRGVIFEVIGRVKGCSLIKTTSNPRHQRIMQLLAKEGNLIMMSPDDPDIDKKRKQIAVDRYAAAKKVRDQEKEYKVAIGFLSNTLAREYRPPSVTLDQDLEEVLWEQEQTQAAAEASRAALHAERVLREAAEKMEALRARMEEVEAREGEQAVVVPLEELPDEGLDVDLDDLDSWVQSRRAWRA